MRIDCSCAIREEEDPVKILVVEDHALVREGLLATLRALQPGAQPVGVGDAAAAVLILEQEDVDLMLLDLMLPGTRGQTFLPVVRRRFPTVPVIVLSALDDAETIASVIKAGASGFISKGFSGEELLAAIRKVLSGEVFVPPAQQEAVNRNLGATPRAGSGPLGQRFGLTPAQERVLDHLAEGNSNRQIADVLGLTEGTVKIHVSAIIKALKVTNRAEAALVANRRRKGG